MPELKEKVIINESSSEAFKDILSIIDNARIRAYLAVNKELIEMYFQIGKYISEKVKSGKCGESIVKDMAKYIQRATPNSSGFSSRNL